MRNPKIALIACSNGYGHIKRLLCLSEAFKQKGITPTLFAQEKKIRILSKILNINPPIFYNFNTKSDIKYQNAQGFESKEWIYKIPTLKKFDHVISDNLLEILEIREDAWISGSFFWHKALKGFPSSKKNYYEELISKLKPKVVSSCFFAPDYIGQYSNLFKIGLFSFDKIQKKKNRENLLISCGKGGQSINQTKNFVSSIMDIQSESNFNKIFIEPSLYHTKMPNWILPAEYNDDMYSSIKSAIIRPGIGTVTDCINYSVPMYCFYEKQNNEMRFNAENIEKKGIGINSKTIEVAWDQCNFSYKSSDRKYFQMDLFSRINLKGAQDFVEIILKN